MGDVRHLEAVGGGVDFCCWRCLEKSPVESVSLR